MVLVTTLKLARCSLVEGPGPLGDVAVPRPGHPVRAPQRHSLAAPAPGELGFGSGQTCRRRLDRWQQAGVFEQLHSMLLAELNAAGELDWSRACVDGSHIRAKRGAPRRDRRRSTGGRRAVNTI